MSKPKFKSGQTSIQTYLNLDDYDTAQTEAD